MKTMVILVLLSLVSGTSSAQPAAAENPENNSGCTWQENNGNVIFYPGCNIFDQIRIVEEAKKHRTPDAGDFEQLNARLDRIIQLLEQGH
jgi:hypothetical protein